MLYSIYFNQMDKSLNSQQDRLDSFYKNQAEYYDTYRKHMLHGRESLIASIPFKHNSNWLDIGGGTGYSINLIEGHISYFEHIWSLKAPLNEQAMLHTMPESLGVKIALKAYEDVISKTSFLNRTCRSFPHFCAKLVQEMIPRSYEPGEILFTNTNESEGMYLLSKGMVEIRARFFEKSHGSKSLLNDEYDVDYPNMICM